VDSDDKKAAKQQFQLFDKILSIQNIFTKKPTAYIAAAHDPAKRQELRQKTKQHGEVAGGFAKSLISEVISNHSELKHLDVDLDKAVRNIVH